MLEIVLLLNYLLLQTSCHPGLDEDQDDISAVTKSCFKITQTKLSTDLQAQPSAQKC